MLKTLLLVFLLLCVVTSVYGQLPTSAQQVQLEYYLTERNVNIEELRKRLDARGIQVDNLTPERAAQLKPQIEKVIAEIEAEKKVAAQADSETAVRSTEAVEKTVNDGVSVQEVITDVNSEVTNNNLPVSDIYGHQIFRNRSLQVYQTTENATPPDSYPLKPGDEVTVSIFGASQTDFILRLDDKGFVRLPLNGYQMPLGGIAMGEARNLLANRLRQFYSFRDGQLSIRIQAIRTISVSIFGEVENNGSFTMSSLNTGFNALVAAGGPTERGTVRNIQIIDGNNRRAIDVYEYLKSPTENTDLFLRNNTTIYVPAAEKIVKLEGGVQRPLRYELKDGETIEELLAFAGGPVTRAETGDVQVTRFVEGQLEIISVNLAVSPRFELLNDDIVNVPVINNPVRNYVTVEGAVFLPGNYPFSDSLSVGSILKQARLRPNARRDVAFLFRSNDDGTDRLIRLNMSAGAGAENVLLRKGDRINILSAARFVDRGEISIQGAIRDTSRIIPYPVDGAITLEEAILLSGGVTTNARPEAVIIRTPRNNTDEKEYLTVPLANAANTTLDSDDRVVIYSQEKFTDVTNVSIDGAVRQAGIFRYDNSLTLQELVYLAGGLKIEAALDRIEVNRLQIQNGVSAKTVVETISINPDGTFTNDFLLQPFDEVVVRSAADFKPIRSIQVVGEVRYPGQYAIIKDKERLTDVIKRAGGLTGDAFPEGATLLRESEDTSYVVLSLAKALDNETDFSNMALRAGDVLSIPTQQDLVTIYTEGTYATRFGVDSTAVGGVLRVAYQGDKSADWYINNFAGGFSYGDVNDKKADKYSLTVEYANGQYKETSSFLGIKNFPKVRPGSTIRMNLKDKKVKQKRNRRPDRFDWIGFTRVVLTGITTIITFYLLRERS